MTLTTHDNRVIVNSLEPRGCFAEIEEGRLHVAINGQGVWGHKTDLARWFGVDEGANCASPTPYVGGGFGMKAMRYPEHFLVALAARQTGRPVHWMSDRTEAMLSDNAGRDLDVTCTLGFDADHRLVAYKVDSLSNLGAYNSQFGQNIQSALFSKVLTGTYDVQTVFFRNRGILHQHDPRRMPIAAPAGPRRSTRWKRAIDFAARDMGVDPLELRRKKLHPAGPVSLQDGQWRALRRGQFPPVCSTARRRRATSPVSPPGARPPRPGASCAASASATTSSPFSVRRMRPRTIEITRTGAKVYVGTQSNGQGHETVYAQLLHDQTGLPLDAIEIVQGDSDLIATGGRHRRFTLRSRFREWRCARPEKALSRG